MRVRRVGLFGGTFDPIHRGHLDVLEAAEAALDLTAVVVIPSNIPPHRSQPAASSYHRFAMVALAVAGRRGWQASDLELRAGATSFTTATLQHFHDEGYAAEELFFITGADAFLDIATWRDYPAILGRAHFAVVSRPGCPVEELPARLPDLAGRMTTPGAGARAAARSIVLIEAVTAGVSGTAIRGRCRAGESLAGLVPAAVLQHIEQHGLYSTTRPEGGHERARHAPAAGRLHGEE